MAVVSCCRGGRFVGLWCGAAGKRDRLVCYCVVLQGMRQAEVDVGGGAEEGGWL